MMVIQVAWKGLATALSGSTKPFQSLGHRPLPMFQRALVLWAGGSCARARNMARSRRAS